MTIWKAGMLAVSLVDGIYAPVKKGDVYRVARVKPNSRWKVGPARPALILDGVKHPLNKDGACCADSFRPAVQDDKSADTDFAQKLYDIVNGRVPAEMQA